MIPCKITIELYISEESLKLGQPFTYYSGEWCAKTLASVHESARYFKSHDMMCILLINDSVVYSCMEK